MQIAGVGLKDLLATRVPKLTDLACSAIVKRTRTKTRTGRQGKGGYGATAGSEFSPTGRPGRCSSRHVTTHYQLRPGWISRSAGLVVSAYDAPGTSLHRSHCHAR